MQAERKKHYWITGLNALALLPISTAVALDFPKLQQVVEMMGLNTNNLQHILSVGSGLLAISTVVCSVLPFLNEAAQVSIKTQMHSRPTETDTQWFMYSAINLFAGSCTALTIAFSSRY